MAMTVGSSQEKAFIDDIRFAQGKYNEKKQANKLAQLEASGKASEGVQKVANAGQLAVQDANAKAMAPYRDAETNAIKIRNTLDEQFGIRQREANIGGQETANKRADLTYRLEEEFGPQRIKKELAAQDAGVGRILDDNNDRIDTKLKKDLAPLQASQAAETAARHQDFTNNISNRISRLDISKLTLEQRDRLSALAGTDDPSFMDFSGKQGAKSAVENAKKGGKFKGSEDEIRRLLDTIKQ